MRVLMLTDLYPPAIGGMERHVHDLSHELARRGHEVSVATLRIGATSRREDGPVRVHRVQGSAQRLPFLFSNAERPFAPPAPDPGLTAALARVIREERPEVVHGHSWLAYSFLPLKRSSGAKLVMTLHDYGLVCPKKTLMRGAEVCEGPAPSRCLGCASRHYGSAKAAVTLLAGVAGARLARSGVDRFLAVSSAVAERSGLPGGRAPFEVVPNFIPDARGRAAGSAEYVRHLPAGDFLLFVGSLARIKGLDVLLDAYDGLDAAPPLVLIGTDAPDTPASFPAGVQVFRSWPNAAVQEAWRRCLLGIVPSIWPEPCPTVALEAMAAGRPLVAARSGGLVDLVEPGVTGLLTTPGDAGELSLAMARLLADAGLRGRMGRAAKRKAADYRARNVVPRIERAYEQVLGAAHGGPAHGGAAHGEWADGGPADGAAHGGPADGGAAHGGPADGGAAHGGPADGGAAHREFAGERPSAAGSPRLVRE